MSSSSDAHTQHDVASSSSNFHQHFRQCINALQNQIDSLSAPDVAAEGRKATTESILAGITKLSATLADASSDLPSYDQRSYNQAIKTLHDQLTSIQAIQAPKAKFTFKNKKLASVNNSSSLPIPAQRSHLFSISPGPSSEVDSATTSRSVTPAHLRDPEHGTVQVDKPIPTMAPPPASLSPAGAGQADIGEDESQTYEPGAKPKLDQTVLTISSKENTYASTYTSVRTQQHMATRTCVVSDISNSIINLTRSTKVDQPDISSLTLTSSKFSLLIAPSIDGPAHITGVRDSVLVLGCRQFRMHGSHNVAVYLHCMSRPIIEDCSGIEFALLPGQFVHGKYAETRNMYDQIDDFRWLRAEHSPNWRVMQPDEQIKQDVWETILERIDQLDDNHYNDVPTLAANVKAVLTTLGRNMCE